MYLFFLVTGFDTGWVPRRVSCGDRFTTFLSFEETRTDRESDHCRNIKIVRTQFWSEECCRSAPTV